MAIYYIATTGNDTTGNGSIGNPWATLYKASQQVTTAGDVIHITAGTYTENNRCSIAVGVSVEGEGKTNTIINSTYAAPTYLDAILCLNSGTNNTAGNQSISNIGFNGQSFAGKRAITVVKRGNVTIYGCDFTDFDYSPAGFYGDSYESYQMPSIWITGNKFYNNTVLNCSSFTQNGLWFSGQDGFEIYGCTIKSLRAVGTGGDCVAGKTNKRTSIHDNTFERPNYDNALLKWDFSLEIRWNYGECKLYNNNFSGLVDLCWNYSNSYAYSWDIHDNTFGYVYTSTAIAWNVGLEFEADTYDAIVRNNRFKNLCSGIDYAVSYSGQAIVFNGLTIKNNVFENIGVLNTFSGMTRSAINIIAEFNNASVSNIYIYNNTLTGTTNSVSGIRLGKQGIFSNFQVKNNIIQGFLDSPVSCYLYSGGGSTLTVDNLNISYNDFYSNGNSNAVKYTNITPTNLTVSNNITSAPLFVSSTDFTLQATSPCRNAGTDVGISYDESAPDIGAFEYLVKSYQKRFYYTFKDITNTTHTIEIWKLADTGTVTAQEVRCAENPFIVTLPTLDNKFQPVRGTGCQINLLSETNMQFMELYTADMLGYQIRAYKGANLIWCGYLDSELYTEPFNELTNYDVSFSGSDGFALLDRMTYLDSVGAKYTGLDSQQHILNIVLQKLGLPITYSYIYLSTAVTGGLVGVGQTLLDNTYVLNENFYDEDGKAMTLREVLESILLPYGAFIMQCNGCYYITDIQALASNNLGSVLKHNGAFSSFNSTVSLSAIIGDISTIKLAASDANLNMVAGLNKQVVKFSPYLSDASLDYTASVKVNGKGDFSVIDTVEVPNPHSFGSGSFTWQETYYANSDTFDRININKGFFADMTGTGGSTNNAIKDTYLKDWANGTNDDYGYPTGWTKGYHSFQLKTNDIGLYCADGDYALKVEISVYPRFKDDLSNGNEVQNVVVTHLLLHTDITLGDKHLKYKGSEVDGTGGSWVDSTDTGFASFSFYDRQASDTWGNLADKWIELSQTSREWEGTSYGWGTAPVVIPLAAGANGTLGFNIYGYSCHQKTIGQVAWTNVTTNNDIRIKDIRFTLVDSAGNDLEKLDIEYVGYMNEQYANEGEAIEFIQGTNTGTIPTARGGLLRWNPDNSSYTWIQNWTRAGTTDIIEKLLLRSYVGNYENKTIELSATTNILPTYFGYLTYSNYLAGKKFMITGLENNYSELTSKVTMQEIFVDSLTLNSK